MDKCPKCGGEVEVLVRSSQFWGNMNCVAIKTPDSRLKADIAAVERKARSLIGNTEAENILEEVLKELRELSV